jgi:hypothetical protein
VKTGIFFLCNIFFVSISCENNPTPCGCADNLRKINSGFDAELDQVCDNHLDKLNKTEAKKWTDSMMNCKSASK